MNAQLEMLKRYMAWWHGAGNRTPDTAVMAEAIDGTLVEMAELVAAGRAVVDRWDSPQWKDQPHTGEFIARLRAAVEKVEGVDA